MNYYDVINILIGIVLLAMGRKLFWLFVGCIGFAIGFNYAPYIGNIQSGLLLIGLAAFTGILGAVLAVFFQKIMVGLVGFAAGGYIALNLSYLLGIRVDQIIWLPYLIGGIIGALLLFLIFDWALIIVSSFAGASVITQAVSLNSRLELGLFFALVIFGVVIQTALFRNSSAARQPDSKS